MAGWQVFGRYVLNDTPVWAERGALLLVLYCALLGAAVGVRDQEHLSILFVREALPARARHVADLVTHLLVGGFGAGMVWFGVQLSATTWTHTIPTLGFSESFTYLPIPLSGALIVLFSFEHVLNLLTGRQPEPRWS